MGASRQGATLIPFDYGLLRSRPTTETVPAAGPARDPPRLPRQVRRPVSVGQTEFVIKGDWLRAKVCQPTGHDRGPLAHLVTRCPVTPGVPVTCGGEFPPAGLNEWLPCADAIKVAYQ